MSEYLEPYCGDTKTHGPTHLPLVLMNTGDEGTLKEYRLGLAVYRDNALSSVGWSPRNCSEAEKHMKKFRDVFCVNRILSDMEAK